MQGKTILIVDDEMTIRKITERIFQRAGAVVYTAADGKEAMRKIFQYRPDLVVLDIMMPGENGWDVCQEIRKLSEIPVIMLTALNSDDDIIHSLEAGADDFVSKPFNGEVLLARARAVLRRSQPEMKTRQQISYNDGYLSIDLNEHRVQVRGQPVKLTSKEFKLLEYLTSSPNRVLTFNQILENVWGWEYKENPDYIHVYISHLRQKIEPDPKQPQYIITEHGVGYQFLKKAR